MLRSQDKDRVRLLTLARPASLNAFSRDLYVAVADALEQAGTDPGTSVVILTGEGRAFSAGVDLHELAARKQNADSSARPEFDRLVDALVSFPKPLICAVNGVAVGVGATILGLADLVLMSTTARIQLPFAKRAVAPEAASTFTFPHTVGRQTTAWLMFSASWMSAEESHAAGLAWRVVDPDLLLAESWQVAREIAAQPIDALMQIKRLLRAADSEGIRTARQREDAAHGTYRP